MRKLSPIERNLQGLMDRGYWVVLGPSKCGNNSQAVAVSEHACVTRVNDTIAGAISDLARDLKDCGTPAIDTAEPNVEAAA